MKRVVLLPVLVIGMLLVAAGPAWAFNPDALVTHASPTTPFSQNKQNEPTVAIDANHPNVLVAGSNDEIDMEGVTPAPTTPVRSRPASASRACTSRSIAGRHGPSRPTRG